MLSYLIYKLLNYVNISLLIYRNKMSESLRAGFEFEKLVGKLLKANNFQVLEINNQYDFLATIDNHQWAIEVKYYRTARPQLSLIEFAANRLLNAIADKDNIAGGILIVACSLNQDYKQTLKKKFGLVFIDRADLFSLASRTPNLADELSSLLEEPEYNQNLESSSFDLKKILEVNSFSISAQLDTTGSNLCEELRSLKRGKASWCDYEKLCDKILKYLFPNDLHGWHTQKRTDDGLNRFDYVCRIKPATDFWSFLIDHLNSRYIIFEFKNYSGKIKQGQILTTEKYLLENGLRRVAIIFSRAGADDNAIKMIQGAMRENGKLMLILDDDRVCKMLHMKEKGEDPTDLLFEIADDFLLSLPR